MRSSPDLARVNEAATRGIVSDYSGADLAALTLGASITSAGAEQTLLLGAEDFRATIRMHNRSPSEIRVLVEGKQLYWASCYGGHELNPLLDAVARACTSRSVEPLQDYFRAAKKEQLASISVDFLVAEAASVQERLMQAAQYRDVLIGDEASFRARLAGATYIELDAAVSDWYELKQINRGIEDVPVRSIVGTSSHNHSWLLEGDRGATIF